MNQKTCAALVALFGTLSGLPAFATMMGNTSMPVMNSYDRTNADMNVTPILQRAPTGSTGQNPADSQFQSNFYKTPPNMKDQVSTEGFWEKDAPLFPKLDAKGRPVPGTGSMDPETARFLKNLRAFVNDNEAQMKALGITVSAKRPVGMDRSPFAPDGLDSIAVLSPSKDSPRHIPDPLSLANSADPLENRVSSGAL